MHASYASVIPTTSPTSNYAGSPDKLPSGIDWIDKLIGGWWIDRLNMVLMLDTDLFYYALAHQIVSAFMAQGGQVEYVGTGRPHLSVPTHGYPDVTKLTACGKFLWMLPDMHFTPPQPPASATGQERPKRLLLVDAIAKADDIPGLLNRARQSSAALLVMGMHRHGRLPRQRDISRLLRKTDFRWSASEVDSLIAVIRTWEYFPPFVACGAGQGMSSNSRSTTSTKSLV